MMGIHFEHPNWDQVEKLGDRVELLGELKGMERHTASIIVNTADKRYQAMIPQLLIYLVKSK